MLSIQTPPLNNFSPNFFFIIISHFFSSRPPSLSVQMAILSFAYYESLKRYWRRKKYQRISGASHFQKKLKMVSLGGASATRRLDRIRTTPKRRQLPIKLLANFHDAYARMMICVANKIANSNSNEGLCRGKKVAKARQVSVVSSGEEINSKLFMEIYERIVAARQLSTDQNHTCLITVYCISFI